MTEYHPSLLVSDLGCYIVTRKIGIRISMKIEFLVFLEIETKVDCMIKISQKAFGGCHVSLCWSMHVQSKLINWIVNI